MHECCLHSKERLPLPCFTPHDEVQSLIPLSHGGMRGPGVPHLLDSMTRRMEHSGDESPGVPHLLDSHDEGMRHSGSVDCVDSSMRSLRKTSRKISSASRNDSKNRSFGHLKPVDPEHVKALQVAEESGGWRDGGRAI